MFCVQFLVGDVLIIENVQMKGVTLWVVVVVMVVVSPLETGYRCAILDSKCGPFDTLPLMKTTNPYLYLQCNADPSLYLQRKRRTHLYTYIYKYILIKTFSTGERQSQEIFEIITHIYAETYAESWTHIYTEVQQYRPILIM